MYIPVSIQIEHGPIENLQQTRSFCTENQNTCNAKNLDGTPHRDTQFYSFQFLYDPGYDIISLSPANSRFL